MAKKLTLDADLFEGIEMLGIVSLLKDYRLAYFVNHALEIQLKKYADLECSGKNGKYSWYYYSEGGKYHNVTLINNFYKGDKLIPDHKIDFLILVKNVLDENLILDMISKLRKVPDITMTFKMQLSKVKNIDILLETLEMHELKQVIRPSSKKP